MTITAIQAIDLHYIGGGSDKVYHVSLLQEDTTYFTAFAYGRRGSRLNTGEKYRGNNLAAARAAYDKIVSEKRGKGYDYTGDKGVPGYPEPGTSSATAAPTAVPRKEVTCPILSSQPKPVPGDDPDAAAEPYLASDDWVMQEKFDGERLRIRLGAAPVYAGFNRKGVEVALAAALQDEMQLQAIPEEYVLDGENVNNVFHVFDCVTLNKANKIVLEELSERRSVLSDLLGVRGESSAIQVVRTFEGVAKRRMYAKIKAAGGEGVVFKRIDSVYGEGSSDDWVKVKFIERATCIVLTHNAVSSIEVALLDTAGDLVSVGNVTIPVGRTKPAVGNLVEVQYLYAYKGGSLYQPVFKGERTDIDRADCGFGQLKYKRD